MYFDTIFAQRDQEVNHLHVVYSASQSYMLETEHILTEAIKHGHENLDIQTSLNCFHQFRCVVYESFTLGTF